MTHKTFILQAPAKLNLFLHITGKRPDGYHLLQSLMVFVDVGDELRFRPHDSLFIDVEGPFAAELTVPHDNLVYRAAQALAADYKVPVRGNITLQKNLPVASGMAGGSSDAATALRGLAKLWSLPEDENRLMRIAQTLGADVPACLVRRPVWAEGIGEKITYLADMPPLHFVLLNPLIPTPTPEVFRRFRPRYSPAIQFSGRRKTAGEWIADLKLYRNDLTEAAEEVSPLIRQCLRSLEETPNCRFSRLSGSGATCFGIYEHAEAAQAAVNKLRLRHPEWWVVQANLLKQP